MNPFKRIRQSVLRGQAFMRAWAFGNPATPLRCDLALLEANRVDCAWPAEYGFVSSLCDSIKASRMAEIGVAYGYHAEQILRVMPGIRYVGVDPFIPGYDPQDSFAQDVQKLFRDTPSGSMNRLWLCVLTKLTARYGGRVELWRLKSQVAASLFEDSFFDLIYIDGDHTFEGVSSDLSVWFSKIRPGGVFCGDDYDWDGVKRAVNNFADERGLRLESCPLKKWKILVPRSKN